MKFTKYIAAGMIALAGLTSCNDSFLDTEYTNYLDEEAAAEAASKNPDVFLNGMWAWMVTYCQTDSGTVKIATLYMGAGITEGSFLGNFLIYEVRMERFYPSVSDWSAADQAIYSMVQGDYDYVADQVASLIN